MVLYLSHASALLDWQTLRDRSFAVIWHMEQGHAVVDAYQFAEGEKEALRHVRAKVPAIEYQVEGSDVALVRYQELVEKRRVVNWHESYSLPLWLRWKMPWRAVEQGWLVVRSRMTFPCYAAAVLRSSWSLRVYHWRLCVDDSDLIRFADEVDVTHGVESRLVSFCLSISYSEPHE